MFCPYCGVEMPAGGSACRACGRTAATALGGYAEGPAPGPAATPPEAVTVLSTNPGDATALSREDATVLSHQPEGSAAPQVTGGGRPVFGAGLPHAKAPVGALGVGTAFGNRYHIIRLLGQGGMGAVYQAWDDALGVAVALKIIRPEITADPAAARDLERRFKRELLLARQVTHKHVVRIHDLGEIDGIKYLTMPYIQGSDLASILSRERRLPVSRAIAIARQVASGLQAAHDAGVVHRDLKPANVMIDADDQAVIMDFGIARSVSGGGATMAGAVVGTLEYMAPEQAMAQPVDHRADIYALGLMLYDMVLGPRQSSRAESAVAELMARVQKPLPPARSIDPAISEALERVIDRCTQPDPAARYQTTEQLVHDLELIDPASKTAGTRPLAAPPITRPQEPLPAPAAPSRRPAPLAIGLAAVAVFAVLAVGWALRDRLSSGSAPAPAAGSAVSLGIIPFRNASGDRELEWLGAALADMLRTEVGQSSSLRAVPSDRVFQILQDLRIRVDEPLDAATIRRIADFSRAQLLISGQYVKLGAQIRIEAMVHDTRREQPVSLVVTAANENALIGAIDELSVSIRENLDLAPAEVTAAAATSFRPSSSSVPALRHYTEGLSLVRAGQYLEAVKKLEAATKEDDGFALAHARLGQTLASLGYEAEARRASQEALDLSVDLPPAERYLIAGMHARIVEDPATAVDAYLKLLQILPDSDEVRYELAGVYHQTGELDKARDLYQRILEGDPNHMAALLALGRVEIKRGQSEAGLESLNKAQSLAITLGNEEAKATVFYALGIAYRTLNRLEDALRFSEQGLEIRRRLDQKSGIAESLLEIARTQQALGKLDLAAASYQESLELRQATGDKSGIGDTLLDMGNLYVERGQYDRALQHYRESLQVQREVGNQNYEALLLSNIGGVSFLLGNYDEALTNYQRSLTIRERLGVPGDTADTLHNLAEVYERRGRYEQALDRYLKALELRRVAGDKRNAALDRYSMGTVFERQGRLGAALESRKEALDTYRELGERNSWLAEMLSGYANALIQVGRGDEALPFLDEAAEVARNLRNDVLLAQTLLYRGDASYYAGQFGAARPLFEQAAALSSKTQDLHVGLLARLRLARIAVAQGRGPSTLADLQEIEKSAGSLALPHLIAESRLLQGRARIQARQLTEARTVLEQAVAQSREIGLRVVLAQSHHALAGLFAALKDESARGQHAGEAKAVLAEIQKEAQPADVLKRADLREIAGP